MTLQEWLDQNYPTEKTSLDELHAQATGDFIREYLRIRPVSAEDYNARRTHPSRGWYAIANFAVYYSSIISQRYYKRNPESSDRSHR